MDIPRTLALAVLAMVVGAALTEASWTYRVWWARWRQRRRPTPTPRLHRLPSADVDDQSPFGRGTWLH